MDKRILTAVILGVVVAGLFVGTQMWSVMSEEEVSGPPYYENLPAARASLGPSDAPVVVEEYFDFQCPHCHDAADEVVRPLVEEYVHKEGDVRFVYRFFPILGPESVLSAHAAACAADAGSFWPFQHRLMARRGTNNSGAYDAENLTADAEAVGMDMDAFSACLQDETLHPHVQSDFESGQALGLRGTPTFVVNGEVVDMPTLGAVEDAIEAARAEAGSGDGAGDGAAGE